MLTATGRENKIPSAAAEAIATHYDTLDAFYRTIWGTHVHHGLWLQGAESDEKAKQNLIGHVAAAAALTHDSVVCDIGCGYGTTVRWIAQNVGCAATGITLSRAQHAYAVSAGADMSGLRFIHGDWLTNDLPDASFDAAIAIESSEHMNNLRAFYAQARRVIRREGRLVVAAWLAADQTRSWQVQYLLEPAARETHLAPFRRVRDHEAAAAAAAFRLSRCDDITHAVLHTWPSVAARFTLALVRRPSYLGLLLNQPVRNLRLGLAAVRIWLGYRTSALRYCTFTFIAE